MRVFWLGVAVFFGALVVWVVAFGELKPTEPESTAPEKSETNDQLSDSPNCVTAVRHYQQFIDASIDKEILWKVCSDAIASGSPQSELKRRQWGCFQTSFTGVDGILITLKA